VCFQPADWKSIPIKVDICLLANQVLVFNCYQQVCRLEPLIEVLHCNYLNPLKFETYGLLDDILILLLGTQILQALCVKVAPSSLDLSLRFLSPKSVVQFAFS